MVPAYREPILRFMEKVEKSPGGCWLWTGHILPNGYGQFNSGAANGGLAVYAHRWSYAHFHGDIPAGMQVDHACLLRNCVNPNHLRLATNKQNMENRPVSRERFGLRGAWLGQDGRWRGEVRHNRKKYHCGIFDTEEEAAEAARLKRIELYTHNDSDRTEA